MLNTNNLGAILNAQDKIRRYETSHVLHLILSIITAGIWIPIWILITISNSMARSGAKQDLNKVIHSDNKEYKEPLNWNGIFWVTFILLVLMIGSSVGSAS